MADESKLSRLERSTLNSVERLLPGEEILAAFQVTLAGSLEANAAGGLLGGALFGAGKKVKAAKAVGLESQTIIAVTPTAVHTFAWGFGGKAKKRLASWNRSDVSGSSEASRGGFKLVLNLPGGATVHLQTLGKSAPVEEGVRLLVGEM